MKSTGEKLSLFWRNIAPWVSAVAVLPALARLISLDFVDQRYQVLLQPEKIPFAAWLISGILTVAATVGGVNILRRNSDTLCEAEKLFFRAMLPLLPLGIFWFIPLFYSGILLCIFLFSLAVGRFFSQVYRGKSEIPVKKALLALIVILILYAVWGAFLQYRSYSLLAMQWLDWGHFYELMLNTWRGRFFHLNISHGCFMGSRFCPSLLILSPFLLTGVAGFFFAGSLLVASGALPVFMLAKKHGASGAEALLFGLWYLLLPGIVNLNMPLLDGFHEVFLLFPAVLWTIYAYLCKRYLTAALLVLFCFGVRETVPFMFAGFGVTLFFCGRRLHGVLLTLFSLLALWLIIGVVMPMARPAGTVYSHVSFYPHLGNSVPEIALSPILRPGAFWGAVFSLHSWRYYGALFLPFVFLIPFAAQWLFPMVFDLLMVAADSRFDSQTVLRHYQSVMLITLIAASLAGFKRLRESAGRDRRASWFLVWMPKPDAVQGVIAATFAAAVGTTLFFTQIPGLPASDPRLGKWSDARDFVKSFTDCIEKGAEVTAGPRLASFLVGDYESFFDYDRIEDLRRYVLIESFVPTYKENLIRRELLRSDEWTLLKSSYLDERLVQLFERRKRKAPLLRPVVRLPEQEWQALGETIPSAVPELELRGVSGNGFIGIAARVKKCLDCDIGFSLKLEFHDAPPGVFFDSFGHGVYPADFAEEGEVYRFAVPLSGKLKKCSVDLVKIP